MLFQGSWEEIWRENRHGGCWFTLIALSLILVWHCSKTFSFRFSSPSNPTTATTSTTTTTTTAISGSTKIHSQFRYVKCKSLFFSFWVLLTFNWVTLVFLQFGAYSLSFVNFGGGVFTKFDFCFFLVMVMVVVRFIPNSGLSLSFSSIWCFFIESEKFGRWVFQSV